MQNLWWIAALFASCMLAMFVFANQVFRLKGSLVMIYRGIGTATVLLPFVPFVDFIHDVNFYYVCIINGLLIAFLDNRILNASKIFGAELSAMLQPFSIVIEFFAWFIIVPASFTALIASPIRLSLIIASLLALALSITMVKHSKMTKKAFLYILPAMLCVSVIDILCKIMITIGEENLFSAIFYYSMITSLVAGSINAVAYFKQGNKMEEIFLPKNLIFAGLPMIMLMLLIYASKNMSLYLVENPAYAMAVINLYPIWATLANNIYSRYFHKNYYSKTDKRVLALILIAVITLILTVQR